MVLYALWTISTTAAVIVAGLALLALGLMLEGGGEGSPRTRAKHGGPD